MKEKPWEKPQLVVLARNKPDEHVLAICKDFVSFSGTPYANANGCTHSYVPGPCLICSTQADS